MHAAPKNLAGPSKRKKTTPPKTIWRLLGMAGVLLLVLLMVWLVRLPSSKKAPPAPQSIEVDAYALFSLAKKGQYLRHTGAPESEWRACFQEILASCDQQFPSADDEEESLLYRYQGLAQEALGNNTAAETAFKASIDLLKTDENPSELALAKVLASKVWGREHKDSKEEVVWGDYAAWLYQREGSAQSQKEQIRLLGIVANRCSYSSLRQYTDGLHVLEELLAIYQQDKAKYQTKIPKTLCTQGDCYRYLKNYATAINYYDKAIAKCQAQLQQVTDKEAQREIQRTIASITADKGTTYQYWKKYKDAVAQYGKAIEIYQQFGKNQYKKAIATITKSVMKIHAAQAQYQQALTWLTKLENLYEDLTSIPFTSPELPKELVFQTTLEEYRKLFGDEDYAREKVRREALEVANKKRREKEYARAKEQYESKRLEYKTAKVNLWSVKGDYYSKLGQYQKAINAYDKMIKHIDKPAEDVKKSYSIESPKQRKAHLLELQASTYEQWGKYTKAIEKLQEAKKLLEELGPALYVSPITGYTLATQMGGIDYHISELEKKKRANR